MTFGVIALANIVGRKLNNTVAFMSGFVRTLTILRVNLCSTLQHLGEWAFIVVRVGSANRFLISGVRDRITSCPDAFPNSGTRSGSISQNQLAAFCPTSCPHDMHLPVKVHGVISLEVSTSSRLVRRGLHNPTTVARMSHKDLWGNCLRITLRQYLSFSISFSSFL